MIGFDQKYSYEETATRFSNRLRSGMPIDIVSKLDRMEYDQLTPWFGDDGKTYSAVYFVLKGRENDKVVFVDAVCEDAPLVEQIANSWKEFERLFPHLKKQVDLGRAIVALQFER